MTVFILDACKPVTQTEEIRIMIEHITSQGSDKQTLPSVSIFTI